MKVKICGIRDTDNLKQVADCGPDYIGFIFYNGSPRYCAESISAAAVRSLPDAISSVGVFVNQEIGSVLETVREYALDMVQLHGTETPTYLETLRMALAGGAGMIKAFGISPGFNWELLNDYEPYCDYFLFDTKTPGYGGSGRAFDWTLLEGYRLDKPVFLSGGIGTGELDRVLAEDLPAVSVIDMNSKLETAPGVKEISRVMTSIKKIQHGK